MTLTIIEKAAELMGLYFIKPVEGYNGPIEITDRVGRPVKDFNPLTNKSDLMDLECALGIDVDWDDSASGPNVRCTKRIGSKFAYSKVWLVTHPDKFTARAHAVMAVVEQIYDRREG